MNEDLTEELSEREIEVLQLISEGLTNKEVGARLRIHPLTVKAHLSRMTLKTFTRGRAGLVGYGFRKGYLR